MEGDHDGDGIPLIPVTSQQYRLQSLLRTQRAQDLEAIRTDANAILEEQGYDDVIDGEFLLHPTLKQRRKTMLIAEDTFMLILDYLQIYALIMAIAIRWPWPSDWLISNRFIFLANFDVWEFVKVNTPGVLATARDGFIDSSLIRIDYRLILLAWAIFTFACAVSYIVFFISMNYQKKYNLMFQVAKLKRVFIMLAQVFAIPLGIAFAKVFHCNEDGNMDVHNQTECLSGEHLMYICFSIFIFAGLFILLPIWMVMKIKTHIFSYGSQRHEGYLQLKEAEYAHSLDPIWALNLYHLFSSFCLFWAYYRPVMFFMKSVFILSYASLLWYPAWQIAAFAIPLLMILIVSLIKWPFRVTCFNPQLFITLLSLLLLSTFGLVQTLDSNSVFFQPKFLSSELLVISCTWLGFTVLWLVYVVLRYTGRLCKSKPLWPRMEHSDEMAENTRKYLKALLCGRVILEQALTINKLFSPAHEVSRQIQIINAYCREAEMLNDPIHDALWDLLDELIEAHARISPFSLFAESVKPSIRVTANELMKLLPSFKQRLAQREYDFILVSPVKRRMLLKMYALGVFMNGRLLERDRKTFHSETLQRLYNPRTSVVLQQRQVEGDDGVYIDVSLDDGDDMAVASNYRRKHLQESGLMLTGIKEEDDDDDGEEETIRFTDSDMVSSINDNDMEDLHDMMIGVPSRPSTSGVSLSKDSSENSRPTSSMSQSKSRDQQSIHSSLQSSTLVLPSAY